MASIIFKDFYAPTGLHPSRWDLAGTSDDTHAHAAEVAIKVPPAAGGSIVRHSRDLCDVLLTAILVFPVQGHARGH